MGTVSRRRKRPEWTPGEPFVEGIVELIEVPPGKRDLLVWDAALPGFGIRKFASGRASYLVQYDFGRATRRQSLGPVIDGNLKDQRKLASPVLAKRHLGVDAVAEKRAVLALQGDTTVGELIPTYLEERKAELKPRSYAEIKRHLEKAAKPLHKAGVKHVTRKEIAELMDDIVSASGPTAADRVRSSLTTFYVWAIDDNHAEANPCIGIRDRAPANGGRDRTLKPAELLEVWKATGGDHDHDRIVRLLILTGQRREEIGALGWGELDLVQRRIELPPARTKNGLPHLVPLSKEALAIVARIERREDSPFVFGRLDTPFSGWSRCKERLDARLPGMAHWTVHDLRRTFVTLMADRKLAPPHIIEACVNHVSGHKGGVAGIYNRAEYADEKRAAMDAWGKFVSGLVRARTRKTVVA